MLEGIEGFKILIESEHIIPNLLAGIGLFGICTAVIGIIFIFASIAYDTLFGLVASVLLVILSISGFAYSISYDGAYNKEYQITAIEDKTNIDYKVWDVIKQDGEIITIRSREIYHRDK